ncbi:MAG: hypothetical protein JWO56_1633, partial [Acidobacteria bacterium]|nr:hypothetical protein [Acidobacteriota bacterium]
EGSVVLTAVATDAAGNHANATVTIRSDRTAPAVRIVSPAANAIVKGPAIAVSGSLTDASPVAVDVNGTMAMLAPDASMPGQSLFNATISAADGPLTIMARATDAAGNPGTATSSITVDATAPVITFASPADGKATNQSSITIRGSISDLTAVTLKVGETPVPVSGPTLGNAFTYDAPLAADGPATVVFTAVDAAGNVGTKELHVVRDTAAPALQIATPDADALLANLPLVVRGTVTDATAVTVTVNGVAATLTQDSWEASFATLPEGLQPLVVVATDAAGNITTLTRKVTLDLLAPVVTIATPLAASFTKESTITITGTVSDVSLKSITAKGVDGTFAATTTANVSSFTIAGVPVVDGDNALVVIATDGASRTGQAQVVVTRDATLPTVTLVAPEQLPLTTSAKAVITASDNLALASVRVTLNGVELLKATQPPFDVTFAAPASAKAGDTLTLLVEATDKAGNIATATKAIKVISAGVVVGQVLADETGLPVENAQVAVAGRPLTVTTDAKGRYSLPATDTTVVLSISKGDGTTTTIDRVVEVVQGAGTLPVDARLTNIGPATFVGTGGGNLTAGDVTVRIPAGALPQTRNISVTPLSPQGLPNLLPLGWSPVGAFDLRGPDSFGVPASVSFARTGATLAHLVVYKPELHAWSMVQANLTASAGIVTAALPAPGAYALVVADVSPAPPVAAIGDVLAGVPMVVLPGDVVSSGEVTPSTLPPTGGAARGALSIRSATPLPSGTVVQAEVTETFTLSSGQVASEEKRTEDIVTYRTPAPAGTALAAGIPIRPSRSFGAGELVEGRVHLDVFAGRESVRGKSGGSQAVTVTNDVATLTVAAGSLMEDTAVSVTPVPLSSIAQSSAAFQPIAELVVDLSGRVLATPAELSVAYAGGSASELYFIARVERVSGVPGLTVVSRGTFANGRVTSTPITGFAGIRAGGRYIIYRVTVPAGFVGGTTRTAAGFVAALVDVAGVPFPFASTSAGTLSAIAPAGSASVTARVPSSSLTASATVSVLTTQTADVDLFLTGTSTTATITPANNATGVSLTAQVDLDATAPIAPSTADAAHARLVRASDGAVVDVRAVLSASGRTLSLVPTARLDATTRYRVEVNGLADIYGGAIVAAATSFTTRSDAPPQYDLTRIVFAMPDGNGNIHVSAPAGSLPPGTSVLVVNSGNGIVISFTAGNDGSVSGDFPGSIDDTLLVTVTDPFGNTTNFQRSQFVATDGSGRVAVGPGGGVVAGTGGTEIRIPEGALAKGVTFKVEAFGPETYPERPNLPGSHFGSGLRITTSDKIRLKKEGKLVFPKPAD